MQACGETSVVLSPQLASKDPGVMGDASLLWRNRCKVFPIIEVGAPRFVHLSTTLDPLEASTKVVLFSRLKKMCQSE